MKKTCCLLGMLGVFCEANAATMCVPDLSTCESCVPVSASGSQWTVNCCGVDVSGIALFYPLLATRVLRIQSVDLEFADQFPIEFQNYVACYMTYPFTAPNYYLVSRYFDLDGVSTCSVDGYIGIDIAELCMNNFKVDSALGYGSIDWVNCSSVYTGGSN